MKVKNYPQTNDSLLQCPFCGGTPEWHLIGNSYTRSQKIVIRCPKCRIQRTDGILNNHGCSIEWLEEVAVKNWNQRRASEC